MFDQDRQRMYEQFAYANHTGDYSRIDPNQAMGFVQQFMHHAPPQVVQQLFQQYFQQMSPDQRAQFAQEMPPNYSINPNNPQQMAQSFQQMGQQQPNMLEQLFNQGGALGNPLVKAAAVGIAALAAKQMLSNQRGGRGGLGDLVGGMFGGGGSQYGYREDDRDYWVDRGDWDNGHRGGLGGIIGGIFGDSERYRDRDYRSGRRRDRDDWDDDYRNRRRDRRDDDDDEDD